MMQDALDDVGTDPLLLVRLVDDHVPDRRPIHKIGQDTAESHQLISIPGAKCQVSVAEHLFCVFERSAFSPRGLVKQPDELCRVDFFIFGKGNGGLEGGGHLVLDYLPRIEMRDRP